MSLIGFEPVQLDYIKLWIQENAESYKINIWMDPTTLLAGELSGRIEEVAVRHATNGKYKSPDAFRTELIEWQNYAHYNMTQTLSQHDGSLPGDRKFCFDQAAIIFLEKEGLARPGELAQIRQRYTERFHADFKQLQQATCHSDNIRLLDFNQFHSLPEYQLYIKELMLRGNPIAAMDISRLLILKDRGGIYLDSNLLPNFNEAISSRLIASSPNNSINKYPSTVVMQVVLDELTHQGKMPGRAAIINNVDRGGYPVYLQAIGEAAVQDIKNIVTTTLEGGQSVFSPLGDLTVDPYFNCSYAGDNNKAIVATKKSPFIEQILTYIQQINNVIRYNNIDGLDLGEPIPSEISQKIVADLRAYELVPDSRALLAYREVAPYRTELPNRLAPYRHAYSVLMKDVGVVASRGVQPSLHKMIPPFRRAFFATEEAHLSSVSTHSIRFPRNVFHHVSQYDSQYIIQLQDDEEVGQMARLLYNKNADRSAHYRYQKRSEDLVQVNAAANFSFQGKTRLILISHGIFMKRVGGESIVQLLISSGLLAKDHTGDFPIIDRVSIAACYINEATPASIVTVAPVEDENFIESIYQAFSSNRIRVNSISVREKLVAIDVLGRKWTGWVHNPEAVAEAWYIDWMLVKESNRKIIFTQTNDGRIVSNRLGFIKDIAERTRRPKTSYNGRFSVDYITEIEQQKLSGAMNAGVSMLILEDIKQGPILMAADIMALIAGMSENGAEHHQIIINGNEPAMAALQHILRQTENYNNYLYWLDALDLLGGTKKLKWLMEKLFTDPQAAFMRLKERYLHDDFDLFSLDLNDPESAGIIERDRRVKKRIKSIYLGQIEQHLSKRTKMSLASSDKSEFAWKKIKEDIDNIEKNLKQLSKGKENTSLYYHSELIGKSERATLNNTKLVRAYTNPRYIAKAEIYYSNVLKEHLSPRPSVALCEALVKANQNLLLQNKLEINKWGPLLLSLNYDSDVQQYKLFYLHEDNKQKIQLTTEDETFAAVKGYLQQQHEQLTTCYQLANGRLYSNQSINKMTLSGMGTNAVFAIMAIQHWLTNGIGVSGNTPLAKTLQAHTYVAVTQVTFNTTSDAVTLLQTALRQVENGGFTRLFQSIALPIGLGLGLTDVVFSAVELSRADTAVQRSLSSMQLIFSTLGMSLFIGSIVAGILGLTLLVGGLFIVGIALAVSSYFVQSALVRRFSDIEKAAAIADYFNQMRMGWQQGITFQRGILLPSNTVVITKIDLSAPQSITVVFDQAGQRIKKKNALDNSASSYINLSPLPVMAQRELDNNYSGMKSLILPIHPRVDISAISSTRVHVSAKEITLFDGIRFFARQNPDFPFTEKKNPMNGLIYYNTPVELNFNYLFTDIDIVLGNDHYHLIAPGSDKMQVMDALITPPQYHQHLHYHLIAPKKGEATVVLVLNEGQANVTIDCENEQVKWIINARHIKDIELINHSTDVTEGNKLKLIRRTLIASNQYHEEIITTIILKNPNKTCLTLYFPQGDVVLDSQQSIFYSLNMAQLPINQDTNNRHDDNLVQAVKSYLLKQKQQNTHAINSIRLDDFNYSDDENALVVKTERCFYSLQQGALLYTADHDDTIFNDLCVRYHVELIYHNETFAWYQGDIALIFDKGQRNESREYYKNIFWVSHIATKKLKYVYLPLLHLPMISNIQGRPRPAAGSEIVQTQLSDQGIVFEQEYTYFVGEMKKQIHLIYLIDTHRLGSLRLLEVRDLPSEVMQDLINSRHLTALHAFMQQSASDSSAGAQFSSSGHPSIVNVSAPQSVTTVSIGNKLIWPLSGNITTVSGNISANIDFSLLNNSDYLTTLSAVIKGDQPDHYHCFWSVTQADSYQLHQLYLQVGQAPAIEVRLSDFGLQNSEVVSIIAAEQGIAIGMKNGDGYHLNLDQQLSLKSVANSWQREHQHWLIPLIQAMRALKAQQSGAFITGQIKAIAIAPILAIHNSLRANDHDAPSIWYDTLGEKLLICPEMPNAATPWEALGMMNEVPPCGDESISISLSDDGYLNIMTKNGGILDIKLQNDAFIATLFGCTPRFSDADDRSRAGMMINRGELERALTTFCSLYSCPEIIMIRLKNRGYGWFHPASSALFTLPIEASQAEYLGYSYDQQSAYFSVYRPGYLLQISSSYDHDFVENKVGTYQRLGECLILNADFTDVLNLNKKTAPYYLNIDEVSRLWIRTTINQQAAQQFICDIALFDYEVIEITHQGEGALYLRYNGSLENMSIACKNEQLLILIPDKILIINDVFNPQKNTAHSRLWFVSHQQEITLSQLASYYSRNVGNSGVEPLSCVHVPYPTEH